MKELTKKQKLDFILFCMEKIDNYSTSLQFFTCIELLKYLNPNQKDFTKSTEIAKELFPELFLFINEYSGAYYQYHTTAEEDNQVRAIIYSFLYNHLIGEITL